MIYPLLAINNKILYGFGYIGEISRLVPDGNLGKT
jgi:hypothetical protein